ncbi:MAG: hypothetical protein D8M58_18630 [Calditrichaeota bacterium]|nr:MAG: hypothetical protein DWQ03_21310 [Calditrichota bacterium]MBL1207426.1 hypothetical protein [Calditrichota bacterium]NOG47258.1 hypothetical protein [Calditrichota bacterium]
MKKKIFIFISIFCLANYAQSDCGQSKSFIGNAFKTDLVALVTIDSSYHHGFLLNIIEVWRGKVNSDLILVWSNSECETERDQIEGSKGDTLLVSIYHQKQDISCNTKYIDFVEKAGENVFHTDDCETNILKMKHGFFIGQISKKSGTFIEDGKSNFYPYEEEKQSLNFLKQIIAVLK